VLDQVLPFLSTELGPLWLLVVVVAAAYLALGAVVGIRLRRGADPAPPVPVQKAGANRDEGRG
jgi:hypothetical protein